MNKKEIHTRIDANLWKLAVNNDLLWKDATEAGIKILLKDYETPEECIERVKEVEEEIEQKKREVEFWINKSKKLKETAAKKQKEEDKRVIMRF